MLFVTAWLVSLRVRNYERGKPDDRRTTKENAKRRLARLPVRRVDAHADARPRRRRDALAHLLRLPRCSSSATVAPRARPPAAGVAQVPARRHVQGVRGRLPTPSASPSSSASSGRSCRRYVQRPYRIRIKTKPEDAVILATFLVIGVTGLPHRGPANRARAASPTSRSGRSSDTRSRSCSTSWAPNSLSDAHRWTWGLHFLAFLAFLVILPTTKLRHMITSPMNMYLRDKDRPKGAMRPLPNLMETELETFGASVIEDFTWKQLFDTDACTVCGRCTSVCPAHATGKPLDPREIVLKVGEVMARHRHTARVTSGGGRQGDHRLCRTRSSSASPPRSCGRARLARRATRSAR